MTLTAAFETLLLSLHRAGRPAGRIDGVAAQRGRSCSGRWGCFVNTVVLRAELAGEPSVRELLRRTRAASQATAGHEDVPFDAVVKEVQPERSMSYQPLVQVLLGFEPQPPAPPAGWEIVHWICTHRRRSSTCAWRWMSERSG